MTYGEAQAILDDPSATGDVASSVRGLAEFSRFLKRGRVEAGALTLASPEVRFQLDSETHEPLDVRAYEHKETNSLVEEMMLLANVTVARRITDAFPRYAVLRRHPEPPQRNFDQLIAAARVVGVEIDCEDLKRTRELTDNLNRRHVASQHAGRASVALHTVVFFAGRAVLADGNRAPRARKRRRGACAALRLEGPAAGGGQERPEGKATAGRALEEDE
ncbi:hypothetical protein FNF31_08017 [Cafeteria roenbergensis]|uniref:RNB domain-containing protein n=1 Tax=Cafeteria roenbergensis TaxID=33653 RepID=A0A5A8BY17_CAFRO|nr:hypothetical protein FNF31_08017 [Cafeteria roenbergensis]